MKALSIRQPWASLIACGVKQYELRSWQPPAFMLGQTFAIHAGRAMDQDALDRILDHPNSLPFQSKLARVHPKDPFPRGHIIATAVLTNAYLLGPKVARKKSVRIVDAMIDDEETNLPFDGIHNFMAGQWAFRLSSPKIIKPVRWSGQLGFFNVKLP